MAERLGMISRFEITSPAIAYCGAGTFEKLAEETARVGKRAVIVTGSHLRGSERIARLRDELRSRNVEPFTAEPITSEPTVEMVDDLAGFARANRAAVMIAIGGGSVMDAAKAAAVMATNDGPTADYQIRKREIVNPPIAQVFAPTTAGTGSEATRVSVLTNNAIGVKRSMSHPLMTPDAVILDPELTVSCSAYLTTITVLDAFSHAIESAVSRSANAYTRAIALAAIEQLSRGLPECQRDPGNLDARLACLLGSCFAGLSMQAGMGASHSLAPAVCIVSGIRHAEAVGALLPHSIRLNERLAPGTYTDVARAMGCDDPASRLEELGKTGGFVCSLAGFGMKPADWENVLMVVNRYASHRQTNPAEVTDDYARELFELAVACCGNS